MYINIGALSKPLKDQLDAQEIAIPELDCEHFQKDIDAIVRLKIRGYITESEAANINKKFMRKLITCIEEA